MLTISGSIPFLPRDDHTCRPLLSHSRCWAAPRSHHATGRSDPHFGASLVPHRAPSSTDGLAGRGPELPRGRGQRADSSLRKWPRLREKTRKRRLPQRLAGVQLHSWRSRAAPLAPESGRSRRWAAVGSERRSLGSGEWGPRRAGAALARSEQGGPGSGSRLQQGERGAGSSKAAGLVPGKKWLAVRGERRANAPTWKQAGTFRPSVII